MTIEYRTAELENATRERNTARARMDAARQGTRKWRDAERDLSFWQSKVAFLMHAK